MCDASTLHAVSDPHRLAALWQLALLDTPADEAFDRLTRLASAMLHAPVALVSLVDADRHFFKSCIGLPPRLAADRQSPLAGSFCQHVVASAEPLAIENAREHPLVRDYPVAADFDVVAYLGMPLITDDGDVLGSFCVIDHQPRRWSDEEIALLRDLTSAVMTEIGLRETVRAMERQSGTLRRQAELIDLAHDAIIVRQFGTSRITRWNSGAQELYGWTGDEAIGRVSHELLGTIFPMPLAEIQAACVAVGHWSGELRHRTKAGDWVTVDSRWALRRDADGQPEAILEINSDVTARKASETALRATLARLDERTEALEAKTREQESFIHTVAHDLRAPLVAIHGMATMLAEDHGAELSSDARRLLDRAIANADKMQALITDLLALAQVDRIETDNAWVDLTAAVQRAIDEAAPALAARQGSVQIATPLPAIWANPTRVAQVFCNLIGNAIHYTPPERAPAVRVSGADRGETWEIVVADNGVGIPANWRDKVFDLFQRLPAGKQLNPNGTGVGLAIVARIVESLGGRIWLTSEENAGAEVHIVVPKHGAGSPGCEAADEAGGALARTAASAA